MQDRIKQMAVEAGAAKFYPYKQSTTNDAYLVGERFLERFAQTLASDIAQWYAAEGWLLDEDDVPGAIRARFGIEG